jgi:molybdate transport system substrate-binding protein
MPRPVLSAVTALVAATALLAGCGASAGDGAATSAGSASASDTAPTLAGEITVFAAASLTDSFTTLSKQFEAAHPDATVTVSFGPSSGLVTQIVEGAPADVFASASTKNMDTVVAAHAADSPAVFATNVMEIAVPPSNPATVTALADLAKADVKATLTKVALGEVDAGVVYVTDVLAAGDKVTGIEIPADVDAATSYPIATLTASKHPDLAKAFVDYVLSADGATVLTAAGFQQP